MDPRRDPLLFHFFFDFVKLSHNIPLLFIIY
nr:MAG TPA: hypothetical protein [Caudoviricetes sp.]